MALGGTGWCDAELELLYVWLDSVTSSNAVAVVQ